MNIHYCRRVDNNRCIFGTACDWTIQETPLMTRSCLLRVRCILTDNSVHCQDNNKISKCLYNQQILLIILTLHFDPDKMSR